MYAPYDPKTASTRDRIAWALCQIIDDDAPLRWTRYRFAVECIALNPELMRDLATLRSDDRLSRALHEIAEEWAGAECGEPVTAQEAYAIGLAKRMYRLAAAALSPTEEQKL